MDTITVRGTGGLVQVVDRRPWVDAQLESGALTIVPPKVKRPVKKVVVNESK